MAQPLLTGANNLIKSIFFDTKKQEEPTTIGGSAGIVKSVDEFRKQFETIGDLLVYKSGSIYASSISMEKTLSDMNNTLLNAKADSTEKLDMPKVEDKSLDKNSFNIGIESIKNIISVANSLQTTSIEEDKKNSVSLNSVLQNVLYSLQDIATFIDPERPKSKRELSELKKESTQVVKPTTVTTQGNKEAIEESGGMDITEVVSSLKMLKNVIPALGGIASTIGTAAATAASSIASGASTAAAAIAGSTTAAVVATAAVGAAVGYGINKLGNYLKPGDEAGPTEDNPSGERTGKASFNDDLMKYSGLGAVGSLFGVTASNEDVKKDYDESQKIQHDAWNRRLVTVCKMNPDSPEYKKIADIEDIEEKKTAVRAAEVECKKKVEVEKTKVQVDKTTLVDISTSTSKVENIEVSKIENIEIPKSTSKVETVEIPKVQSTVEVIPKVEVVEMTKEESVVTPKVQSIQTTVTPKVETIKPVAETKTKLETIETPKIVTPEIKPAIEVTPRVESIETNKVESIKTTEMAKVVTPEVETKPVVENVAKVESVEIPKVQSTVEVTPKVETIKPVAETKTKLETIETPKIVTPEIKPAIEVTPRVESIETNKVESIVIPKVETIKITEMSKVVTPEVETKPIEVVTPVKTIETKLIDSFKSVNETVNSFVGNMLPTMPKIVESILPKNVNSFVENMFGVNKELTSTNNENVTISTINSDKLLEKETTKTESKTTNTQTINNSDVVAVLNNMNSVLNRINTGIGELTLINKNKEVPQLVTSVDMTRPSDISSNFGNSIINKTYSIG